MKQSVQFSRGEGKLGSIENDMKKGKLYVNECQQCLLDCHQCLHVGNSCYHPKEKVDSKIKIKPSFA